MYDLTGAYAMCAIYNYLNDMCVCLHLHKLYTDILNHYINSIYKFISDIKRH